MTQALSINDNQFQQIVLNSAEPVLVDFWGEGCPPCKAIAPLIDAISEEFNGKARVVKINVNENTQYASEYGITAVPSVLYFKGGELVDQQMGMVSKEVYSEKLNKLL